MYLALGTVGTISVPFVHYRELTSATAERTLTHYRGEALIT